MPNKWLNTNETTSVRFKDRLSNIKLVGSDQDGMVSGSVLTSLPSPREIAFVDTGINDLKTFLGGLRPEVEAIILSDGEPAIRQMARHLSAYSRLERVHVVAHGAPGEIRFSSGTFSERDVAGSTDVFAKIGAALGENGSMQLWCCATGKNEVGKSFAEFLHRCLSRSVAAASGFVGAVALGGSWCLDLQFGNAAPRPPLTRSGLAAYQGVLANFSATVSQDNLTGGPGADTFKIGAGTVQSGDVFDGRGGIDTLIVTAAADFSILPASSLLSMEILSISGSGTAVTFNANQFGASGLSSSLDLRGSTGNQTVIVQNASNFSAAAWTFGGNGSSAWGNSGNDIIAINGTSGADTITGSSSADIVTGGSGVDTLAGGGGDDTFVVNNGDFTGAESIDGGAGANILFVAGTNNFTTGTLTNLRTLNGSSGSETVTLTGTEMNGFTSVNLGSGSDSVNLTSTSTGLNGRNDNQLSGVEAISAAAALAGVVINLSSQSEGFTITGSSSADTITGGSSADIITGGSGVDTLAGGGGDDTFVVNNGDFAGAESINGGAGANMLSVAGTNNFTTGILTNLQTLSGSSGSDTVTLTGTEMNGFTTVNLGSGGDAVNLTSTSTGLNGRNDIQLSGVEAISAAAALAGVVINLSSQSEGFTITGSAEADTITGGAGNDTLDGGSGNDTLVGAGGSDSLFGSGGSDVLIGGEGNDVLYDESGDDVLDGGNGDDTMSDFGGAVASLSGGAGNDGMWTGANMTGTVDGGSDRDVLFVTGGNLTGLAISNVEIYTTSAEFVFGTVTQLDGFDTITTFDDPAHASSLVDIRISGGGSLDLSDELGLRSAVVTADATAGNGITTGVGNDTITGGGGNDTIAGGAGNDSINGGLGNDTFVFAANLAGNGIIGDFEEGSGVGDLISIANSAFESFADILAAGEDNGADWLLTIDDDTTLRLAGVNESNLAANDFLLV
ncbi:hemolysin-type calcium-binding protein [Rhizobium phaseoli]|uniref:DUF4347 domain-containing protein n=1 Tax=Rhizobium phaseoli TaxID=396 RepID=UPI000E0DF83E|nr:DUF4347 domain-containing protein [Rhizobium phaseoli]RDJ15029.1 hemolysin-type calcium-binding protein [Rhizobium phaseoli]